MPVRPYYVDANLILGRLLTTGETILGVAGFGAGRPASLARDVPFASVAMQLLRPGPCYEVWATSEPAKWQDAGDIRFATTPTTLFGVFEADPSDPLGTEAVAYDAYTKIFGLAEATGHPHLTRVFNYIAGITDEENGTERYRLFNAGRHAAFSSFRRPAEAAPAASGLGMQDGRLVVYFIASLEPGVPIENPRQVSAYLYPSEYGPISPSFSRAMITQHATLRQLHISGTASIVGHHSMHPGDPVAQTHEILRNLSAVLSQCKGATLLNVAPSLHMKIYVRRAEDAPAVTQALEALPPIAGTMLLNAEICRKNLLVEIEAFCQLG